MRSFRIGGLGQLESAVKRFRSVEERHSRVHVCARSARACRRPVTKVLEMGTGAAGAPRLTPCRSGVFGGSATGVEHVVVRVPGARSSRGVRHVVGLRCHLEVVDRAHRRGCVVQRRPVGDEARRDFAVGVGRTVQNAAAWSRDGLASTSTRHLVRSASVARRGGCARG